jgi:Temperature dependent protein affecting M2 dsRNA replication
VEALEEPKCRHFTPAKDGSPPLKSKAEILFNVMGRFLQLRGFLDEKRELTGWGRALRKALSSLDSPSKLEDSVYLALEMLRLGLLDESRLDLGSTKPKSGE